MKRRKTSPPPHGVISQEWKQYCLQAAVEPWRCGMDQEHEKAGRAVHLGREWH